ncbi:hypothetical protein HYH03_013782 [Edaphochlamys debaryana]|uniref:MADS-box domain-containing protein n=1 Tax=Edaphochlamys debaryana TaxID=47281 RepID=A0A836BU83_9CHLO|nr:hypothetical protein HYH03_013782 [Edaphochlamys debaryana]|eukprot:KAG2487644.1 hypothetical protein HYH03_013782 [Edaphochlamys debaryana]
MELSVLCDCDVALIVFAPGASGPGGQRLYQYSSVEMDELLERYAAAVAEPHERRKNGELLRHYYELSPDEDDSGSDLEEPTGAEAGTSAAAAAAAEATMAAVDSIILGRAGPRRDSRDGSTLKRGRHQQMLPPGLGTLGGGLLPGGRAPMLPGGGLAPLGPGWVPGLAQGLGMPGLQGGPLSQPLQLQAGPGPGSLAAGGPGTGRMMLRAGGSLGGPPAVPLEGVKAAGFLDKSRYPLSPRSEKAFDDIDAELDRLTELRKQATSGGAQQQQQAAPGGMQPMPNATLAAQQAQLHQLLLAKQAQHAALQAAQAQQGGASAAGGGGMGGGAKRFKPLSIMVPENQAHPILSANLTPLESTSAAGAAGGGAGAGGAAGGGGPPQDQSAPMNGAMPRPGQPGGLPPRAPVGQRPTTPGGGGGGGGGGRATPPISPAMAAGQGDGAGGGNGGGNGGQGGMDLDSVSAFAFHSRPTSSGLGGGGVEDGLLGYPMRPSLDGSAINLLTLPSPPPHGMAAHALFGSLDGGPLSIRSSSHGMLGALGLGLGLERGASLGFGALGLESPGGPGMGGGSGSGALDPSIKGLAPMDVLEWPSSSPRSSAGNSGEDEGEGGMIVDGLVVTGTALSKLGPEAQKAAIGPSPDVSGGGATPVSSRSGGGGGGGRTSSSGAFTSPAAAAAAAAAATAQGGAGEGGGATEGTSGERRTVTAARVTSLDIFAAAADGLTPELSFNALHGGSMAAAAATVAAQVQQQQQEAGKAAGEDGAGGEGGAGAGLGGLEVVGRALAIPGGGAGGASAADQGAGGRS